jgi:hypothetical protein
MSGQTLTPVINGKVLVTSPVTRDFTLINIPVDFTSNGQSEIILRYGIEAENAVLYKTLALRDD